MIYMVLSILEFVTHQNHISWISPLLPSELLCKGNCKDCTSDCYAELFIKLAVRLFIKIGIYEPVSKILL